MGVPLTQLTAECITNLQCTVVGGLRTSLDALAAISISIKKNIIDERPHRLNASNQIPIQNTRNHLGPANILGPSC